MLQIRFHSLTTSALILGLLSGGASAAVYTWDGGTGGADANWTTKQNWGNNTVPTPTSSDQFVFGGVARLTNNNDIGNFTITSLTFDNTAGAFVLGSTLAYQFTFVTGAVGITNSSTSLQTINMALGLNVTTTVATTSGDITIGGAISGTGGLTKTGANTLTLSSATNNSYTGATSVNEGTLLVNTNIATSATTVASGATIGGSGTTGALTVQSGGFINPGATGGTSTGILTTGSYTQAGTYNVNIGGLTAGTQHDQISVVGTVNITGGSLSTIFTGSYSVNDIIYILLNDSNDAITGTYSGLLQGATFTGGGSTWQISYTADSLGGPFIGGGNDIAIMAIPEPSTVLLGVLGTVLLLLRRRRPDHI